MKFFLPSIALVLTVTNSAHALTIGSSASLYTDAGTFNQAESIGIQLLTDLNAVEGNPDGTFAPRRTLNRAEFLKIVLLSHPEVELQESDVANCFPDVQPTDWFSQYVCYAKENMIVAGYPDGMFRPSNPVNYAEALKILAELYDYTYASEPGELWYKGYAEAAISAGTALPEMPVYNTNLTRGQMARLAAAFYAHSQGELTEYRQAEQGLSEIDSSSSSSESSSSSVQSSSESSSSSSESSISSESSSTPIVKNEFSLQSHLLVSEEESEPIIGGIFTSETSTEARIISVRFDREVRSIESLVAKKSDGTFVSTLTLDLNDSSRQTWRGDISNLTIPANEPVILYVHAQINSTDGRLQAGELITPREIRLITKTVESNISQELIGGQPPFPAHIVTLGEITAITNSGATQGAFVQGSSKIIANMTMTSETKGKSPIQLKELTFTVRKDNNVNLNNIRLGRSDTLLTDPCSLQQDTLSCFVITQELQPIGESTNFVLLADIDVQGDAAGNLQVELADAGSVGVNGSVRWSDGVNDYRFVDLPEPLYIGAEWTVE